MRGVALVPPRGTRPGPPAPVSLPGARRIRDGLVLAGLTVVDARGDVATAASARSSDGGPGLAGPTLAADRLCGVTTVLWQLSQALQWAAARLRDPLPALLVRVGEHGAVRPAWAGGHYRLPARRSRIPEPVTTRTGEIHLGVGRRFLPVDGPPGRRWDAPAHNPAILLHEFGHHVVRHTSDPRANERAGPEDQDNRKSALDEGTADFLAAALLGTPDIYGWHRGHLPRGSRRRRDLDAGWTMRAFTGGRDADPHDDGQVWAGALWAARVAAGERTGQPDVVDGLLVDALVRLGRDDGGETVRDLRRRRQRFGAGLAALLEADDARGTGVGDLVERAFAERGIVTGASNTALAARCTLPPSVGPAASSGAT